MSYPESLQPDGNHPLFLQRRAVEHLGLQSIDREDASAIHVAVCECLESHDFSPERSFSGAAGLLRGILLPESFGPAGCLEALIRAELYAFAEQFFSMKPQARRERWSELLPVVRSFPALEWRLRDLAAGLDLPGDILIGRYINQTVGQGLLQAYVQNPSHAARDLRARTLGVLHGPETLDQIEADLRTLRDIAMGVLVLVPPGVLPFQLRLQHLSRSILLHHVRLPSVKPEVGVGEECVSRTLQQSHLQDRDLVRRKKFNLDAPSFELTPFRRLCFASVVCFLMLMIVAEVKRLTWETLARSIDQAIFNKPRNDSLTSADRLAIQARLVTRTVKKLEEARSRLRNSVRKNASGELQIDETAQEFLSRQIEVEKRFMRDTSDSFTRSDGDDLVNHKSPGQETHIDTALVCADSLYEFRCIGYGQTTSSNEIFVARWADGDNLITTASAKAAFRDPKPAIELQLDEKELLTAELQQLLNIKAIVLSYSEFIALPN